jgi:hypothetical protein
MIWAQILAMTYLAHQSPRLSEANEPDFKMESFGKLLTLPSVSANR